jgi:DNA-binding transcriptional LysR family regulator
LSGEADFGIGPERDAAPQLEARELMEMPFEAVVPPDHPLAARDRLTWSDLAAYPLITLRGQFTERLLADMSDSQRDVTLKPAHEVTYMTTALAMVASGLGITICMPYAAPLVRLHGLRMLPLDAPVLTRRFFVYTREQRSLSPAAAAFIAFLFDYVHASGVPAAGAPAAGVPAAGAPAAGAPASGVAATGGAAK